MSHGTVGWVQVDTDDPESAKQFYGGVFDWTFAADPNAGGAYHMISRAGAEQPHGGILDTAGGSPNQATFAVEVSDVPAAIEAAERLGGKVVNPLRTLPTGLVTADLQDPAGNVVGVFCPPAR